MRYGEDILAELGRLTGGRVFFPHDFKQLGYFIDLIHVELRSQYVLAYVPADRNFQGEWRKIKIRLEPPGGLPKLTVRARERYYASGKLPPGR